MPLSPAASRLRRDQMTYHVQECVGATAKRIHLDTAFFREIVYQAPGADRPVVVAYIRVEYADPVCAVLNISGVDPCLGIEPRAPSAADDRPADDVRYTDGAAGDAARAADEGRGPNLCRVGVIADGHPPGSWCSLPKGHDGPHISPEGVEFDGMGTTDRVRKG